MILLPLLIGYVYLANQTAFSLLITIVVALALREYLRMALPPARVVLQRVAIVAGMLFTLLLGVFGIQALVAALTLTTLLVGIFILFDYRDISSVIPHLSATMFGILYIPLLLGHIVMLHGIEHGKAWVFFVMFLVMASDSSAYFTGISIGRHKLYPAISPKKSIEGALGGLVGGIVAAFIVRMWFFPQLDALDCVVLGIALGAVSQLGDLFESMLKRCYDVKDSGSLIPGHGGILDRLDSLLFAYPLAYYYAIYLF